jgi:hypothetical protein
MIIIIAFVSLFVWTLGWAIIGHKLGWSEAVEKYGIDESGGDE